MSCLLRRAPTDPVRLDRCYGRELSTRVAETPVPGGEIRIESRGTSFLDCHLSIAERPEHFPRNGLRRLARER